jgi:hypothetical protein
VDCYRIALAHAWCVHDPYDAPVDPCDRCGRFPYCAAGAELEMARLLATIPVGERAP